MSMQLPISTLASADSPEGRFLAAADQAGDKNGQISIDELKCYAAAKPEQADLIGQARIADWTMRIGNAKPAEAKPEPRQADISTAPAGQDALELATRYAQLLKSAGLEVTDVKATESTGIGKITGARVTYKTAPTNDGVAAATRSQEVSVSFLFGNAINQAAGIVQSLRVTNAVILDIEITSTFGTGKIAGMRIDYCTRDDYQRNTTG